MMDFHDVTVNIGKDGRRTADRQKPEDQKLQKQRTEVDTVHHSYFHAAITAHGASAAITQSNGQRITPTPINASTPKNQERHCLGTTAASLITVAKRSPAATLAIPPSACCTYENPP